MLKTLIARFNPFRKNVSSVMATFQKTLDDLAKVSAQHRLKSAAHDTHIEKLLDKIDTHTHHANQADAEADAADRLREKLSETFGLAS